MDREIVKREDVEIEGRAYEVRYYASRTARGTRRFSAEVVLGEDDCIIFDAASLPNLQSKVRRLAPATVLSRTLAGGTRAGDAGRGREPER